MFSLQEFIVTNPKGETEFLNQIEYLKRMAKLAGIVKNKPEQFLAWAKLKGIPAPMRKGEDGIIEMSTEHLRAFLTDNGFKFEEL